MPLVVFIQYSIILLISIYGIIESAFSLLHVSDGMIDQSVCISRWLVRSTVSLFTCT